MKNNKRISMKKFVLEQSGLPWNFFSEIGLDYEPIVIRLIQSKFINRTQKECEDLFEKNCDSIDEELCNEDLVFIIDSYWVGEEERDESSGTWGYSHYLVEDVQKAKEDLEKEIILILDKFVSKLKF